MNVGRLKALLKDIPDEYEIEITIGESGDLLKHIFVDNDFGFIELTDYEDEPASEYLDMFGNYLHEGDKVIYIHGLDDGTSRLRTGKITEFNKYAGDDDNLDLIMIEDENTGDTVELYKSDAKKIMLYKW